MKKLMIKKSFLFTILAFCLFVLSGPVFSATLFYDGFESGDLVTGGWVTFGAASADGWGKYNGNFSAKLAGTAWMQKSIDTTGSNNITINYYRSVSRFATDEHFFYEYSVNGTDWTILEQVPAEGWAYASFTCGSDADDNPNFRFRFRTNANRTNKAAYIDDVTVTSGGGGVGLVFDVSDTLHTFDGLGTMIWPGQNWETSELGNLNIKYVRIIKDYGTWEDMAAYRGVTDALGIKWLYTCWNAPPEFESAQGMLDDVPGFAAWWRDQVITLDSNGCKPEYIDLMNEPDSGGAWSTGITPSDWASLVKQVRSNLDAAGYSDVGIAGPGLTNLNWDNKNSQYIGALDAQGVAALAAFSYHAWDDGDICGDDYSGGASCLEGQWPDFGLSCDAKDPAKPKWITEYATKENVFHGVTYPPSDNAPSGYSAACSMSFAVRTYENTLVHINQGASVPYYWSAGDGGGKVWGYISGGFKRCVYYTLKDLSTKIPVGASVVSAPSQASDPLYAGVFVDGSKVIVCISNDDDAEHTDTIQLQNAPNNLGYTEAVARVIDQWNDPSTEIPDTCQLINRTLSIVDEGGGSYSFDVTLPADSTLTIVLEPGGTPDNTVPSPDPAAWQTSPYATGPYSIAMVAQNANDASGVEYYFESLTACGHDSGWQDSSTYEDTGLLDGTQYTYQVKVRDKSPYANVTAASSTASATTNAAPMGELLTNVSFECGGDPPTDWTKSMSGGSWAYVYNEPVAKSGTVYAGVGTWDPGTAIFSRTVSAAPSTVYELSAWAKNGWWWSNIVNGKMRLDFKDTSDNSLRVDELSITLPSMVIWKQYTLTSQASPANTAKVTAELVGNTNETHTFFDDVSLTAPGSGYCGDDTCDPGEDQCNCPEDCGTPPSTETSCTDSDDNDCDTYTDCDDSDCDTDPACIEPYCGDENCDPGEDQCNCPDDCGTPPATETNCTDGDDNDCDTYTDCDDSDCDTDPACDCAAVGEYCEADTDCCSGNCFERKNYCKN
jgi:hypothetical protein